MDKKTPLYVEIADQIISHLEKGTLKAGDKVPSIRKFSQQMRVSINTIKEAYSLLETRRVIEAKPQSGYYICNKWPSPPDEPEVSVQDIKPTRASADEIFRMIMKNLYNPRFFSLGVAEPNHNLLPKQKLNQMLASETKKYERESISYIPNPGLKRLRNEIAKLYLPLGLSLKADDIYITGGCMDAIILTLFSVCKYGDTVAMESPSFPLSFHFQEQIGLKIIEIPSHPQTGMNIDILEYAIENNEIKACIVVPNFNNPQGSLMPDDRKKRLVALLSHHNIPLIEDDIFGELSHTKERPGLLKCFDKSNSVIHCSSFSKTIAPGYRIGWAIPGKYKTKFESIKVTFHTAPSSPVQLALAEFLSSGGYDRFIRKTRRIYACNMAKMAEAVGHYFPNGTRLSRPKGGYILWIVMPEQVDSLKLFEKALNRGIVIAPGTIFSQSDKFRNCMRINAAYWSPDVDRAIHTLGTLAKAQMD